MKSGRTLVATWSHRSLLVALLLVLAGVTGPGACQVHDVQCGDVLDIDHGHYKLSGDLVCPIGTSTAAVTITGEGVHFNLAGHTITRDENTGEFLREGIAVMGANAHIRGGSIVDINCPRAFGTGQDCAAIRLFEAPSTRINGMSLHNNTVGITAFRLDANANGARIHGNDITGNLRTGIGLFSRTEGVVITDNDLSDTGGFTLPDGTPEGGWGYVGSGDDVSLIDNVANNCASAGIILFGNADFPPALRNTIRDNTTLGNPRGIVISGPTEALRPRDNLIQSNTSFGNGVDLIESIFVGAPPFPPAADCLNTWMDNDFDTAAPDCIE